MVIATSPSSGIKRLEKHQTNKAKLGEENGYPKETSEGESSDQSEGSEGEEKSQGRTTPRSLRSILHQQPTELY
jgi:hypothetical protein